MYTRNNFVCVSIPELSLDYNYEEIQSMFQSFYCVKNAEIEKFIKDSAIEFVKKCQAITYIIFDVDKNEIVAYFTLSIKAICFEINSLSNTTLKRMERIADVNYENNSITPAAFLIAQLGKKDNSDINIDEIFYFLDKNIIDIQNACGGVVEFLESENNDKLISLYKNKGFKTFNIRKSKSGEERKLIQMYRLI
ncbi:MAG: hypothetical protein J6M39_04735 [Lachnospiraceae bacterium]|nr:hypothetical protein [Lachnospiraceae bacterium]